MHLFVPLNQVGALGYSLIESSSMYHLIKMYLLFKHGLVVLKGYDVSAVNVIRIANATVRRRFISINPIQWRFTASLSYQVKMPRTKLCR